MESRIIKYGKRILSTLAVAGIISCASAPEEKKDDSGIEQIVHQSEIPTVTPAPPPVPAPNPVQQPTLPRITIAAPKPTEPTYQGPSKETRTAFVNGFESYKHEHEKEQRRATNTIPTTSQLERILKNYLISQLQESLKIMTGDVKKYNNLLARIDELKAEIKRIDTPDIFDTLRVGYELAGDIRRIFLYEDKNDNSIADVGEKFRIYGNDQTEHNFTSDCNIRHSPCIEVTEDSPVDQYLQSGVVVPFGMYGNGQKQKPGELLVLFKDQATKVFSDFEPVDEAGFKIKWQQVKGTNPFTNKDVSVYNGLDSQGHRHLFAVYSEDNNKHSTLRMGDIVRRLQPNEFEPKYNYTVEQEHKTVETLIGEANHSIQILKALIHLPQTELDGEEQCHLYGVGVAKIAEIGSEEEIMKAFSFQQKQKTRGFSCIDWNDMLLGDFNKYSRLRQGKNPGELYARYLRMDAVIITFLSSSDSVKDARNAHYNLHFTASMPDSMRVHIAEAWGEIENPNMKRAACIYIVTAMKDKELKKQTETALGCK